MQRRPRDIAGLVVVAILFTVMMGCMFGAFAAYDAQSSGHQVDAFYFLLMGVSVCALLICTILLVLTLSLRARRRGQRNDVPSAVD